MSADLRPDVPVPDPVVASLNRARSEIVRIAKFAEIRPGVCDAKSLATADALLAIVVAVEELARQVRK